MLNSADRAESDRWWAVQDIVRTLALSATCSGTAIAYGGSRRIGLVLFVVGALLLYFTLRTDGRAAYRRPVLAPWRDDATPGAVAIAAVIGTRPAARQTRTTRRIRAARPARDPRRYRDRDGRPLASSSRPRIGQRKEPPRSRS